MICNHECLECEFEYCLDIPEDIKEFQEEFDKELKLNEKRFQDISAKRRWELEHYDRSKENKRRWYEQNQEYYAKLHARQIASGENKGRCKRYYNAHKAERSEYMKKYYELHKEELKERNRAYKAKWRAKRKEQK